MKDTLKFRQAIYRNGKFLEFHYWGYGAAHSRDTNFTSPQNPFGQTKVDLTKHEQCSGFKDKNFNFIYDGDIIISDNILNDRFKHFVVSFENGKFVIDRYIDGKKQDLYDFSECFHIEIVGNIHTKEELWK